MKGYLLILVLLIFHSSAHARMKMTYVKQDNLIIASCSSVEVGRFFEATASAIIVNNEIGSAHANSAAECRSKIWKQMNTNSSK
ncbi:MAG: hypothetical protein KAT04_08180 [Methylococcales bacterium]|nr:hypothetical protein [Methylococcales bacterium]